MSQSDLDEKLFQLCKNAWILLITRSQLELKAYHFVNYLLVVKSKLNSTEVHI